jgi:hypothetical protein
MTPHSATWTAREPARAKSKSMILAISRAHLAVQVEPADMVEL